METQKSDAEIVRKCAELMGWKPCDCGICQISGEPAFLKEGERDPFDFDPLTNPADWWMLIEFARAKGWSWEIEYAAAEPCCARMIYGTKESTDWFISNEPGRAVCLAFIAAMGVS
jgi:hypothetical protein